MPLRKMKEMTKDNKSHYYQYKIFNTLINISIQNNKSMKDTISHCQIINTKCQPQYNSDIEEYITNDANKPIGYDEYINQFKIQTLSRQQ